MSLEQSVILEYILERVAKVFGRDTLTFGKVKKGKKFAVYRFEPQSTLPTSEKAVATALYFVQALYMHRYSVRNTHSLFFHIEKEPCGVFEMVVY